MESVTTVIASPTSITNDSKEVVYWRKKWPASRALMATLVKLGFEESPMEGGVFLDFFYDTSVYGQLVTAGTFFRYRRT